MPFDAAAPLGVGVFLERFGDDGKPIVVQPVDQRAERRKLLLFGQRRIIEGADEQTLAREEFQQALVIDIELQPLGGAVEIGAIDEKSNFFLRIEQHHITSMKIPARNPNPGLNGPASLLRGVAP